VSARSCADLQHFPLGFKSSFHFAPAAARPACAAVRRATRSKRQMSESKQTSADLILKLYDLRREETMRKARDWMIGFNPDSMQDIIDAIMSDKSAYFRMVTSYWEMAAALVNHGGIDEEMFIDANGEHLVVFAKLQPFLAEMRAQFSPNSFQHLEKLVMRMPDADQRLADIRERFRRFAAMRAEREQAQTQEATA
jgi:hypothetical protein